MSKAKVDYFRQLNQGEKLPWKKRLEKIKEQFQSIDNLDWDTALSQDVDLFGRIIRDIIKADVSEPGRVGPRPALDYHGDIDRYRQLAGEDSTILDFPEAFGMLAANRSIRHIASKTGLKRDHVHRLLRGTAEPTMEAMEAVAEGFGKQPSFFKEYREIYIAGALYKKLQKIPDSTMGIFRKLNRS